MAIGRQAKPFFRESKRAWYLQLGKRQISLGKDKELAWQKYHQIMASGAPIRETATIEQLFERYLDWVKANRKPATYEKIRRHLSAFARFIGQRAKIAALSGSITSEKLRRYQRPPLLGRNRVVRFESSSKRRSDRCRV